ncbi:MAG: hypothetical protein ACYDHY_07520 [Acidiferrobacterales bacterium]
MANWFLVNQTPSTYTVMMYNVLQVLLSASWNCLAWSDGSTVHNTGTIPGPYAAGPSSPDPVFPITGTFPAGGASGVGGLDNANAWFVLRQPPGSGSQSPYSGKRMICFQHSSASSAVTARTLWRIKYTVAGWAFASNTGTTPGPASDEVVLFGSQTDLVPSFDTLFPGTEGSQRWNIMANDGLSNELSPFGFYAVGFPAGGGVNPNTCIMMEPLTNGTFVASDVDPYVFYVQGGTNIVLDGIVGNISGFFSDGTYAAQAWFRYGLSQAQFQGGVRQQTVNGTTGGVAACTFTTRSSGAGNLSIVPGTSATSPLGTNAWNGNDDFFPVIYARRGNLGGQTGYKGVGAFCRVTSASHSTGDTFTKNTTRDYIAFGSVNLPWNGSVPII